MWAVPLFFLLFSINCIKTQDDFTSEEGIQRKPQKYNEYVFKFPKGVRSELDIPICPKFIPPNRLDFDQMRNFNSDNGISERKSDDLTTQEIENHDYNRINSPDHKNVDKDVLNPSNQRQWACNVVHKRFFYPPVVERLCRCPGGDECPWEWIEPPHYGDKKKERRKHKKDVDTIMIGSRSQMKFCQSVTDTLPKCNKKGQVNEEKDNVEEPQGSAMTEILRNVSGAYEFLSISVNCYCPPLFRHWKFRENSSVEHKNGTAEEFFHYDCEKLPKCRTDEQCGNIRNDLHSVYFHCSCPPKHLCKPKNYPAENHEDENGPRAMEALYHNGRVTPIYCLYSVNQ